MEKTKRPPLDSVGRVQLAALKANRHNLTKQQYKTLRGQILAGNGDGAIKGLYTIVKRKEVKK